MDSTIFHPRRRTAHEQIPLAPIPSYLCRAYFSARGAVTNHAGLLELTKDHRNNLERAATLAMGEVLATPEDLLWILSLTHQLKELGNG